MNTAEKIYAEVQALTEQQAREVLDFVARLSAKRDAQREARRAAALRTLAEFRNRYDAVNFDRDELHERENLH